MPNSYQLSVGFGHLFHFLPHLPYCKCSAAHCGQVWSTKVSLLCNKKLVQLYLQHKYLLSKGILHFTLLGTTGWKNVAGQGVYKSAFFWAPQLIATSSSRPCRWREEKQPLGNTDRSVAVLILERKWCIWLSFKTYFLSSWPKTGGFADQRSWLEYLWITLGFEIKEEKTTSYSLRIRIPPHLPLEDTWLILAALLSCTAAKIQSIFNFTWKQNG